MVNFSIKRKGYDKKQVDTYLKKVVNLTDNKLKELRQRVDLLRQENRKMRYLIDDYKAQEKNISDTLLSATKKANEIVSASEVRYKLEGERLRIFREKWCKYVESAIDEVYQIDESVNMKIYLDKMDKELYQMINRDLNIKKARPLNSAEEHFISEQDRLAEIDKGINNETIADIDRDEKVLFKKTLEDDISKNIEEIEYSDEVVDDEYYDEDNVIDTNKTLSEICKELGINLIDE